MSLLGLSWSALLGLLGAFGAATVALYILKLRRRPVAVPFAPLWERLLKDRESSQLFSQLKRWLSLVLQLVLLALVVLALGDPRLTAEISTGRQVVILVDTSASMNAHDVKPSRLEVAKKQLVELLRGLSSTDRVLIAEVDAAVRPVTPMTSNLGLLQKAIEQLSVSDTRADFRRALSFAADALRGAPHGEVVIVSDGAADDLDELPAELEHLKLAYLPVGSDGQNVAITTFAVRRYPLDRSRHEVMLELVNTSEAAAQVELTLISDGDVIEVAQLALGPGERLSRFYENLAGADRKLEATLTPLGATVDQLSSDNRAYALVPERHQLRVLLVSRGNTYLEAALLLDEYLHVVQVAPEEPLPEGPFDVTILDGVAPPLGPGHGGALYLNPPPEQAPVRLGKEIRDFGFDEWDKKTDVLAHIAPDNIQIARGHRLEPLASDRVLGASALGAILVEGVRQGQRFIQTGFDPRDSDFVLRVAWPLFVLNVIHHFVEEDGAYVSSFATGTSWDIPVGGDITGARLSGPGGLETRVPIRQGHAVFFGERAGFYQLTTLHDDTTAATLQFAANLSDPRESAIAPQKQLKLRADEAPEPFRSGLGQQLWVYLLAAAILLSVVEWVTYHKRVTV